jgi:hypothetical protein
MSGPTRRHRWDVCHEGPRRADGTSSTYAAEAPWLELWGCKPGGPSGPRRPGRQCRFCRPVQEELSGHVHRANGIVCAGFTGSPSREEKHAGGWNGCPPREPGTCAATPPGDGCHVPWGRAGPSGRKPHRCMPPPHQTVRLRIPWLSPRGVSTIGPVVDRHARRMLSLWCCYRWGLCARRCRCGVRGLSPDWSSAH